MKLIKVHIYIYMFIAFSIVFVTNICYASTVVREVELWLMLLFLLDYSTYRILYIIILWCLCMH